MIYSKQMWGPASSRVPDRTHSSSGKDLGRCRNNVRSIPIPDGLEVCVIISYSDMLEWNPSGGGRQIVQRGQAPYSRTVQHM